MSSRPPRLQEGKNASRIRMIWVPHASSVYSGAASHTAFASAAASAKDIDTVILLCTRHSGKKGIVNVRAKHAEVDHSYLHPLEFVQHYFPSASCRAYLVGPMTDKTLMRKAKSFLNSMNLDRALLVVSGDLMHVGPRFSCRIPARAIDDVVSYVKTKETPFVQALSGSGRTRSRWLRAQSTLTICGWHVARFVLALPCTRAWIGSVSCYYTSLHVTTSQHKQLLRVFHPPCATLDDNSVSYLAMTFRASSRVPSAGTLPHLTPYEQHAAQYYAAEALRCYCGGGDLRACYVPFRTPAWNATCGAFVTLTNEKTGALRGCIGRVRNEDKTPLFDLIPQCARLAAQDHRSGLSAEKPVKLDEIPHLKIHVTLLECPSTPVASLKDWRYGRDALYLEHVVTHASGIYLPSVPLEQGWTKTQTAVHLVRKMNMDSTRWKETQSAFRVYSLRAIECRQDMQTFMMPHLKNVCRN